MSNMLNGRIAYEKTMANIAETGKSELAYIHSKVSEAISEHKFSTSFCKVLSEQTLYKLERVYKFKVVVAEHCLVTVYWDAESIKEIEDKLALENGGV